MVIKTEILSVLYSMGIKRKVALGPNPLAVKKKSKNIKKDKPRRKRKGKRSKALSLQKEMARISGNAEASN